MLTACHVMLRPSSLMICHVIPDRAPDRITEVDVVPYILYAGNLGASGQLFQSAPINTDDRPLIEYMAPKTRQQVAGGQAKWLIAYELVALFDQLFEEVSPEDDPYLKQLSAEQVQFVRAGRQLQTVSTHVEAGRLMDAAPLYREFLGTIPFDIFPGLANRTAGR